MEELFVQLVIFGILLSILVVNFQEQLDVIYPNQEEINEAFKKYEHNE